jgi:hypothetical protein
MSERKSPYQIVCPTALGVWRASAGAGASTGAGAGVVLAAVVAGHGVGVDGGHLGGDRARRSVLVEEGKLCARVPVHDMCCVRACVCQCGHVCVCLCVHVLRCAIGMCADEYTEEPDGWTPQLYVRESIRLVSND